MDVSSNRTSEWPLITPVVSVPILDVFLLVNDFALCCSISLLGVLTNLANIIVFIKMGFADTSNMSFLTLSVFDFLVSLAALISKSCYSPVLRGLVHLPTATAISSVLTLLMFCSVGGSAMTTALIATERCLCVVFPLKMKTLTTQRRVLYLLLLIVAYHVAFLVLLYADTGPPYDNYSRKMGLYYFSFYAVPSTTCFFIVLLATIAMVTRLNRNLQWRRETTQQSDKTIDKESRIAKTITAISTIFIVCFFPNVANFIAQAIYPAYNYSDPYLWSLITVVFSFCGVLQAISSSINILFYYRMSSRYKKVFSSCFSFGRGSCKD